jgi:hypothetical protein
MPAEALLVTSLAFWRLDGTLAFLQKTQQDERQLRATSCDRASRCATRGLCHLPERNAQEIGKVLGHLNEVSSDFGPS